MGALRLFLAIGVLLAHYLDQVASHLGLTISMQWTLNVVAGRAVLLFYVVSGFLISYALHHKYPATRGGTLAFFRSRFLRIYPLWWLLLFVAASVPAPRRAQSLRAVAGVRHFRRRLDRGLLDLSDELLVLPARSGRHRLDVGAGGDVLRAGAVAVAGTAHRASGADRFAGRARLCVLAFLPGAGWSLFHLDVFLLPRGVHVLPARSFQRAAGAAFPHRAVAVAGFVGGGGSHVLARSAARRLNAVGGNVVLCRRAARTVCRDQGQSGAELFGRPDLSALSHASSADLRVVLAVASHLSGRATVHGVCRGRGAGAASRHRLVCPDIAVGARFCGGGPYRHRDAASPRLFPGCSTPSPCSGRNVRCRRRASVSRSDPRKSAPITRSDCARSKFRRWS